MTPHEVVDSIIANIERIRAAYDGSDDYSWRAQSLQSMGIELELLVPAVRRLIDANRLSPPSRSASDTERCHDLEALASNNLFKASRLANVADNDWPNDMRREMEKQAVALMEKADSILDEVREIVARHTQP